MLNSKLFIYFSSFLSLVYIGLINFDEELLFLLTFLTIVITAVKFFGQSLALQLDSSISLIVKDFVVLASAKSLSLSAIRVYSHQVGDLGNELESLVAYTYSSVSSLSDVYRHDFNKTFQLLKHRQLKLLLLEGLQLVRLLYVRRFLMYWRDLKDQLIQQKSSELALPISSSYSADLLSSFYGSFSLLDNGSRDSSAITVVDLLVVLLALRSINNVI
jgi:hypothetical protein